MSWPTKKLGEVCEIKKGKKPKLYKQRETGMLPYLGARFMRGSKEAEFAYISDKNSIIALEEDLIIICDGSKSGDIFSGFKGILSSTMGKMEFSKKELDSKYLKNFLDLNFSLFNNAKRGAAIPHLDFNLFKNLEIPLPPLSEQKKIVARLEKMLVKVKEAKRLRAEAQNDSTMLIPAALDNFLFGNKKWPTKKIFDVCERVHNYNGHTLPPGPFKYIDISSVHKGKGIVEHKFYSIGDAPSRARRPIKTNDILFALTRPYLRNIAYVDQDYDEAIASTGFSVLRANKKIIDSKFLFYIVNSDWFVEKVLPFQRGATYPAVGESFIWLQEIPLPPMPEQKKIVARLDKLSEKIHRLEEHQKSTQSDLAALEQSILHRAFN